MRAVGCRYKIVDSCLQHNHDMHLHSSKPYVSNRRLTPEQESEVVELMDTLDDARQVCYYIRDKFNCLFTVKDARSLKARYKLKGQTNEVEADSNGPALTGKQSTGGDIEITADHTPVSVNGTVSPLEDIVKYVTTALGGLGVKFSCFMQRLRNILKLMSSGKDCEFYCLDKLSETLFDVSDDAAVSRFLSTDSSTSKRHLEVGKLEKPIPSTSNAPLSKNSSKRKSPISIRITDDVDTEIIKDHAQLVKFREFRTMAAMPSKMLTSSGSVGIGDSHFTADICSICGLEESLVDLGQQNDNQEILWLQCVHCQHGVHWKCANYSNEEQYFCIHCQSIPGEIR